VIDSSDDRLRARVNMDVLNNDPLTRHRVHSAFGNQSQRWV
jgi:hypothetical protein